MYEDVSDNILLEKYQNGDEEAFNTLMKRYKALVISKAREFYLIGGETDDLIQEGTIGLLEAVNSYNKEKNVKFITFATLCIKRRLIKAVEFDNTKKNKPLNSSISYERKLIEGSIDEINYDLNPEKIYIEKITTQGFINELKKTLSVMENQVLKYFLDGDNYKEIAKKLNKTEKSIDNCINRILKKATLMVLS